MLCEEQWPNYVYTRGYKVISQGSRALMREVCDQIPNLIDQAEKNLKMVRYYTLEGVQYLKFSR